MEIKILIFLALMFLGFVFGKLAESRHYASIKRREEELANFIASSNKMPIFKDKKVKKAVLVNGNVAISVDYFKKILAGLRNIFGGSIQSYETLIDRARREAILRLKESCSDADEIINLRLETSSITKRSQQIGCVEVLAYATAIYYE